MAIKGTITLKDGATIEIDDQKLVNNALKVSMSTCSGLNFDFGTFNAATMQLSIFDDDALNHEFDGAAIALSIVKDEDNLTPIGIYYVDGNKTKRQKNVVQLYAQDATTKFDVAVPENMRNISYTPYNAVVAACEAVGVTLKNSDFADFPNALTIIKTSSASIQTLRDLVMWCAQLLCVNAVIDRDGRLEFRKAVYTAEGGAGSAIIADYESMGDDRVKIQFSDVRTYIKYMTAYVGSSPVEYSSGVDPSDAQARQGEFSAQKNPLIESLSADSQKTINETSLEYLDTFAPRSIKTTMFFDANRKLGDTIRFSGGSIDVRRSIVGVVTGISWKYRGLMTVTCAAPQAVKAV